MGDSLKIIAITLPDFFTGEAPLIELMLRRGIERVHIRKPDAAPAKVAALVAQITPELRRRLSLHGFASVAATYGTGLHLNAANTKAPSGFSATLSRSCHSLREVELSLASGQMSYVFLSPIFDSISKPGYCARFNLAELNVCSEVVALGGVTPERLPLVRAAGFGGAAMLGYLWADTRIEPFKQRIDAAIYHSHQ